MMFAIGDPMFTLGEAAKETGLSKTAISRAIKSGRVSASRKEGGQYEIDPVELFRVYSRVDPKGLQQDATVDGTVYPPSDTVEVATLKAENAALRSTITGLERDKGWLQGALDSERELAYRLTLQLGHSTPEPITKSSKPVWKWWVVAIGVSLVVAFAVVAYLKTYS
jgi:hypothetical protein